MRKEDYCTIGIDARLYAQTGVGTYLRNLLFYLQLIIPQNWRVMIYVMKEDLEKMHITAGNFITLETQFRWHSISEQLGFLRQLTAANLDLMHFTYFSYPILYRRRFIATVHDLTPLMIKTGKASTRHLLHYLLKYLAFKKVLASQIKNSKAIITPTKAVKDEIVSLYGSQYADKIMPIYEGVDYQLLKQARENTRLRTVYPFDFFVYVGNFYPHKNVERLIRAFSMLSHDSKLILIGPRDFFSQRLLCTIRELKQEGRILFFHDASMADLVFFYKHAKALLHPSLSEGFGLPLLEAAYFNLPVIVSDIPVFKEILGERYLSFNPLDTNDMVNAMQSFLKKKPSVAYGRIIRKYSFATMVKETLSVYKHCLDIHGKT